MGKTVEFVCLLDCQWNVLEFRTFQNKFSTFLKLTFHVSRGHFGKQVEKKNRLIVFLKHSGLNYY